MSMAEKNTLNVPRAISLEDCETSPTSFPEPLGTMQPEVTRMTPPLPTTVVSCLSSVPAEKELKIDCDEAEKGGLNMDQLHAQEMEMAAKDGMEMLRNVFDSMAIDGKITMDQLPFVLVGAEVQATAKEIDDAIEEAIPDADDMDALLDFDQVQTLYQQLIQNFIDAMPAGGAAVNLAPKATSIWHRMWSAFQYWRQKRKAQQTAYEKHMKPTTRLLILILFTSLLISLGVVLFAMVFIWMHSAKTIAVHVERDARLMADGLHRFGYIHPFAKYDKIMGRLALLLGTVVEGLGYNRSKDTAKNNLFYQQQLLSKLLDNWFGYTSLTAVSMDVMATKVWADQILSQVPVNITELVAALDDVNPGLPAGHEILLAKRTPGRSIEFLTKLRFQDACGVTSGVSSHDSSAAQLALNGGTGSLFDINYCQIPVAAGYSYLPSIDAALIFMVDLSTFRQEFREPAASAVNAINAQIMVTNQQASSNITTHLQNKTQEMLLAVHDVTATHILTTMHFCDAKCAKVANYDASVVGMAARGSTGLNDTVDFNGAAIFAAYGPLPNAGLGMAVKVIEEEFLDDAYDSLGKSLDNVNGNLKGSLELQFVSRKTGTATNGTLTISDVAYHTTWRFSSECGTMCGKFANTSPYLVAALAKGESGVMQSHDYRGMPITAGYASLSSMHAALSVEMDHTEILVEGVAMAKKIANYQNDVRYAGTSTEILIAQKKSTVKLAQTLDDYIQVTPLKHVNQCPNSTCHESPHMIQAVNKKTGFLRGRDYRDQNVLGAYTHVEDLDIGVVIQVDVSEAELESVKLAVELVACSTGAVLISMVALAVLANLLLKSIDRTWEEGKRAIERERNAFRKVIEAMYPSQVAKRLLCGETQIVYNVSGATVFFSDIYEFTSTSNAVTPEELIQFLGYTFGAMDVIADYYHIYKVKTIGDAYMALSGLPGMDSPNGNATLDMMLFASCCAQVFSSRFLHPEEGAILDKVVINVLGRKKHVKVMDTAGVLSSHVPRRPSQIIYGNPKEATKMVTINGVPPVHCVMRYGLAAGAITAGVLQGKTPLFDIWGRPVNLASRMESTGQPGRIQVAEAVYHTITAIKGQPFTFDPRHTVFCKGFGNVRAYFIRASNAAVPEELMASLNIDDNHGQFHFQNPVPGFRTSSKGTTNTTSSGRETSSQHGSSSGQQSARSSVSGGNVQTKMGD